MPDGTTGSPQPPPKPGDEINQEITIGGTIDWLTRLLGGGEFDPTAGGGGAGGKFMFASIDELESVIGQWKTELEAIIEDGNRIRRASEHVGPPAKDMMSEGQANATKASLVALQKHNDAMRDYAKGYIRKLEDSKQSMINNDQSGQGRMNNLNRG